MSPYAKVAGVWKHVSQIFIKQSGVWKTVTQGYIKSGGVWKLFYVLGLRLTATNWLLSSHNSSYDYVECYLSGLNIADHGGVLYDLYMSQDYDSSDENLVVSWSYRLMYDSGQPAPSLTGNVKVTNLSTGVAVTLPNSGDPRTFFLQITNGAGGYPNNPNDGWIRSGSDLFKIEQA